MNSRELMELALAPFRSRTDFILGLLNDGSEGVREAIERTALEFYCYTCREWKGLEHGHGSK